MNDNEHKLQLLLQRINHGQEAIERITKVIKEEALLMIHGKKATIELFDLVNDIKDKNNLSNIIRDKSLRILEKMTDIIPDSYKDDMDSLHTLLFQYYEE